MEKNNFKTIIIKNIKENNLIKKLDYINEVIELDHWYDHFEDEYIGFDTHWISSLIDNIDDIDNINDIDEIFEISEGIEKTELVFSKLREAEAWAKKYEIKNIKPILETLLSNYNIIFNNQVKILDKNITKYLNNNKLDYSVVEFIYGLLIIQLTA